LSNNRGSTTDKSSYGGVIGTDKRIPRKHINYLNELRQIRRDK